MNFSAYCWGRSTSKNGNRPISHFVNIYAQARAQAHIDTRSRRAQSTEMPTMKYNKMKKIHEIRQVLLEAVNCKKEPERANLRGI